MATRPEKTILTRRTTTPDEGNVPSRRVPTAIAIPAVVVSRKRSTRNTRNTNDGTKMAMTANLSHVIVTREQHVISN